MRKILKPFVFTTLIFLLFLAPKPVFAHCPLCTIATGAAVSTTRAMGVDDAIVGLFIGAFVISTAFWFDRLIKKRFKKSIPLQAYLLSVASLIITILTFAWAGLFGVSYLNIFGFIAERLMFGIILGSIVSIAVFELHNALRKFNKNKNYIPLQAIVLLVAALAITGFGVYLIGLL